MNIKTFDHVALWVSERAPLADLLTTHLGMHVIDETDKFTLVGADARRGKLTLFDADGDRDPGVLSRVVLGVRDVSAVASALPPELGADRSNGRVELEVPQRLGIGIEQVSDGSEWDISRVVLRVSDPDRVGAGLEELGFIPQGGHLRAGTTLIELEPGGAPEGERPLLNHLAVLVDSADEHIREAERRGIEIADVVDAANTYALFVWGPDRIKVEYVEHKPGFALV